MTLSLPDKVTNSDSAFIGHPLPGHFPSSQPPDWGKAKGSDVGVPADAQLGGSTNKQHLPPDVRAREPADDSSPQASSPPTEASAIMEQRPAAALCSLPAYAHACTHTDSCSLHTCTHTRIRAGTFLSATLTRGLLASAVCPASLPWPET